MLGISYSESIYLDMYTWGLKQIPLYEIEAECAAVGKEIRQKDYDNYWRGYYKSARRDPKAMLKFSSAFGTHESGAEKLQHAYCEFDKNPLGKVPQRWVPCNGKNKPMIKWSQGCMMHEDAVAYPGVVWLAENLRHTNTIVIDCDGDHDEEHLDLETIFFLYELSYETEALLKPREIREYPGYEHTQCTLPASFHLTYRTDRIIPTIHCPWAHVDILGNQNNQLRYLKNKQWNGVEIADMTDETWSLLQRYLLRRKEEQCER